MSRFIGILFLMICFQVQAQDLSNLRRMSLVVTQDSTVLDSMSLFPASFEIQSRGAKVDTNLYSIEASDGLLIWYGDIPSDSMEISFRVLPDFLNIPYSLKDTSIIMETGQNFKPYVIGEEDSPFYGLFNEDGLNKSGSISRGIAFGNAQNLSVNSSLDLQLSGKLSDRVNVLASITDSNIPIQPEGNTQQLQDFDQVYIQLYNDQFTLLGGDFQLRKPTGSFLTYWKRGQGASLQLHDLNLGTSTLVRDNKTTLRMSAAVSKGKFGRNLIQGVEGNQGPYRLTGGEGEVFIVVLAGTERVYIDGRELKRGKEFDYTIDYNAAELTFTPSQPITKDKRIVVEFQYSDKNYARSLVEASAETVHEKYSLYLNVYGEQDARNQPLQQDLDALDKQVLSDAGDDLFNAVVTGVDSVGYSNDEVLYALVDTLGYDTVFVVNNSPDSAFYRVAFSYVGPGLGDYVESGFTSSGRTFLWVAPDTVNNSIAHNGTHRPLIQLVTPKKSQMVNGGGRVELGRGYELAVEGAISNTDLNSFSSKDNEDNVGYAWKFNFQREESTRNDSTWTFTPYVSGEGTDNTFRIIERFRSVEFERDWNIGQNADQLGLSVINSGIGWKHSSKGRLGVDGSWLNMRNGHEGFRVGTDSRLILDKSKLILKGSAIETSGLNDTRFVRHKADLSREFGPVVIGYSDEHELNEWRLGGDTLLPVSYQFYDWQVYLQSPDESKNRYRVFYRQRQDRISDTTLLRKTAYARQYGAELDLLSGQAQKLRLNASRRELIIQNEELINQEPENTIVGRVDYNLNIKKGFIQWNTYYEVGSGLEQKREFIYLEVPAGQGVYVWIDYDEDGVKDLNEFETAQFAYEANYIRTFIQTNDYIRTFSNQFSQNLAINPVRLGKSDKKVLSFLQRFSNQTSFRIDRKTTYEDISQRFNPVVLEIEDTNLISLNSSWRSTFFFNRTDPVFGMDYTYQNLSNKALLTNGFDLRENSSHGVRVRWNFATALTMELFLESSRKVAESDVLTNRNFDLFALKTIPAVSWQPSTDFRLTVSGEFADKENRPWLGDEKAQLIQGGVEARYSKLASGSVQGDFNLVQISYTGETGNSLAFEMLDGLMPGTNLTWSASIQRKLSGNLQLNLLYNGRKSEDLKAIHSGGAQVRAFF